MRRRAENCLCPAPSVGSGVDATYRADLRELNEFNFARFDAKVDQRIGALDQRIGMLEARLEQRLAEFGADLRMEMARRFAQVESRIGDVKHEMLRWMLASWSTMMLVLLGTLFAVLRAR